MYLKYGCLAAYPHDSGMLQLPSTPNSLTTLHPPLQNGKQLQYLGLLAMLQKVAVALYGTLSSLHSTTLAHLCCFLPLLMTWAHCQWARLSFSYRIKKAKTVLKQLAKMLLESNSSKHPFAKKKKMPRLQIEICKPSGRRTDRDDTPSQANWRPDGFWHAKINLCNASLICCDLLS